MQGIQLADKKCRKLNMGKVPWSPEIKKMMTRIDYIQRCRLKYIMKRQINSRTLSKWFHKTDLVRPITNAADTVEALKQQFKIYYALKKEADMKRNLFLEELAEAQALEGNYKKEAILRKLILIENQRAMFRKIKMILGKCRQGISAIESPNELGIWELQTEKERIEYGCIEENIRRFTQAKIHHQCRKIKSNSWDGQLISQHQEKFYKKE
jgi:hypothetical protein